jgi:hypothetical protein
MLGALSTPLLDALLHGHRDFALGGLRLPWIVAAGRQQCLAVALRTAPPTRKWLCSNIGFDT